VWVGPTRLDLPRKIRVEFVCLAFGKCTKFQGMSYIHLSPRADPHFLIKFCIEILNNVNVNMNLQTRKKKS